MTVHFQEQGSIIYLGDQTLAISTPTVIDYVNASQCDCVTFVTVLDANAADTAAHQVTYEILAAEDNTGTNAEVVSFTWTYVTDISGGTGVATKEEYTDANGAQDKQASYVSAVGYGNNQVQICIPIRSRQCPQGKNWLGLRLTAGTATRDCTTLVLRDAQSYGVTESSNLSLL